MAVIDHWTGARATALRHAMRLSIEGYADHLGVSVGAINRWAAKPDTVPYSQYQQVLDTVLTRLDDDARQRFSVLVTRTDADFGFTPDPAAARSDLVDPDTELCARIAAAARVDGGMVRILQTQTDNIRRLDRRLGAPVLLDQMTGHVGTLRQLLCHAVLDSTRRPLAATLADAAALAGWQALDVGAVSRAWQFYGVATEAGRISGCPELLAHARGEQAYALLDLGRPTDALQLVREARLEAGSAIPARMVSWLWSAEAELAAAAGLDTDSRQALDQAAASLPGGPCDDPDLPYVSLDEHHLARWRGSALARLGDREAIDQLGGALSAMPPEFVRATSGLLIDLSQALIAADAPDAAADHLRTAETLVTQIGSARQRRRLAQLAA